MHQDLTVTLRQVQSCFGKSGASRFSELAERVANFNRIEGARAYLRFERDSGHVIITDSSGKFSPGAMLAAECKAFVAVRQNAGGIAQNIEGNFAVRTERYPRPGLGWEIVLRSGEVAGQTVGVFEPR